MSLADYLAKNYLTADSKSEKKSKKRKRKEIPQGITIADDDISSWKTAGACKEDEERPITGMQTTFLFSRCYHLAKRSRKLIRSVLFNSLLPLRRIPQIQVQQLAVAHRRARLSSLYHLQCYGIQRRRRRGS